MDWVVDGVKSYYDCYVDFDLVWRVDGHWMPQMQLEMELSSYYEVRLEVHAAYVAVETVAVVALPDSYSQVVVDCTVVGSLVAALHLYSQLCSYQHLRLNWEIP